MNYELKIGNWKLEIGNWTMDYGLWTMDEYKPQSAQRFHKDHKDLGKHILYYVKSKFD